MPRVGAANFDSKCIFMHFWITELNFGHPFYGVIRGDDGIVVTLPVLKLTMLTVGVHAAMGIMPRVIVITWRMLPSATRNLGVNSVHFLGWNLDVLITGTIDLQQNVTGNVHIVTGIVLSRPWSGEARFPMPCETANSSRNALFITLQLGESECRLGELITRT